MKKSLLSFIIALSFISPAWAMESPSKRRKASLPHDLTPSSSQEGSLCNYDVHARDDVNRILAAPPLAKSLLLLNEESPSLLTIHSDIKRALKPSSAAAVEEATLSIARGNAFVLDGNEIPHSMTIQDGGTLISGSHGGTIHHGLTLSPEAHHVAKLSDKPLQINGPVILDGTFKPILPSSWDGSSEQSCVLLQAHSLQGTYRALITEPPYPVSFVYTATCVKIVGHRFPEENPTPPFSLSLPPPPLDDLDATGPLSLPHPSSPTREGEVTAGQAYWEY